MPSCEIEERGLNTHLRLNGKCSRGGLQVTGGTWNNVKGIVVSITMNSATNEIEQRTPETELQMKGESGQVSTYRI